jgi:hypothetical protein
LGHNPGDMFLRLLVESTLSRTFEAFTPDVSGFERERMPVFVGVFVGVWMGEWCLVGLI